jgi:3',5'-cyclic AMP phosphodiesterase CpdA
VISLAHFGDPHLSPLPTPSIAELCSKRVLGYLSWQLRRKHVYRTEVLRALTRDAVALGPDLVAVVGDLTNIALPDEFPAGLEWLRSLGTPERVSLVPGNHDAYVALPWGSTIGLWQDYMAGDGTRADDADAFPSVRVRDRIAMIGINTAIPTLPFFATGTIGARQLARLDETLTRLGQAGLFRVVVLHHPPINGLTKWRKRLTDSNALRQTLSSRGAELVLHGHTHASTIAWLGGSHKPIPVVGVTSPSCDGSENADLRARYNIYRIDGAAPDWRVDVEVRGLRDDSKVGEIERFDLFAQSPGRRSTP